MLKQELTALVGSVMLNRCVLQILRAITRVSNAQA